MYGVLSVKKDIIGKIGREIARRKRRRKLINHDFSIISNSCVGGVISNSLKERFNSPTVNLMIDLENFIDFCNHLSEYSKCPVEQTDGITINEEMVSYPVGIIRGKEYNLPDIPIRFVHYQSFEEAKAKWESRFRRIYYDNLFIVMEKGMYVTDDILDKFYALPYKNKVCLTERYDPERWPNNFILSYYTKELYVVGNVYNSLNIGLAQYRWLDEFDYVTWLNSGIIQSNETIKKYIYMHGIKK